MSRNTRDSSRVESAGHHLRMPAAQSASVLNRASSDQIQRGFRHSRQIGWLTVPVDVHVENPGILEKELIVQRSYLQTVIQKRGHHGVHFVFQQHQIAHNHVLPACAFPMASQPPNPNGVGVLMPSIVAFMSFLGMLDFQNIRFVIPLLPQHFQNGVVFG
jgi:hypothetical protein